MLIGRGRILDFASGSLRNLRDENRRLKEALAAAEAEAASYTTKLDEGDHRIKNSLQIVASIVRLQADRSGNALVIDALESAASRIRSIARMHDAIRLDEGSGMVGLGKLIEEMCLSMQAMAGTDAGIHIDASIDPVRTTATFAQPVVLAINELIMNATRHAFPRGRKGTITISLRQQANELRILVADDGVGAPADAISGNGYGMRLVRMLTEQVNGVLDIDAVVGSGTQVTMVIPLPD